jgi:hypothetical protein
MRYARGANTRVCRVRTHANAWDFDAKVRAPTAHWLQEFIERRAGLNRTAGEACRLSAPAAFGLFGSSEINSALLACVHASLIFVLVA